MGGIFAKLVCMLLISEMPASEHLELPAGDYSYTGTVLTSNLMQFCSRIFQRRSDRRGAAQVISLSKNIRRGQGVGG